MNKYLVIYPDGDMRWIHCDNDNRLNCFHESIGCDCVENVYSIFSDICLIVDDEGRVKTPPQKHNPLASLLYGGWLMGHKNNIVGPCILAAVRRCDNEYGEYDWFPLNDEEMDVISIYLGRNIPGHKNFFNV